MDMIRWLRGKGVRRVATLSIPTGTGLSGHTHWGISPTASDLCTGIFEWLIEHYPEADIRRDVSWKDLTQKQSSRICGKPDIDLLFHIGDRDFGILLFSVEKNNHKEN